MYLTVTNFVKLNFGTTTIEIKYFMVVHQTTFYKNSNNNNNNNLLIRKNNIKSRKILNNFSETLISTKALMSHKNRIKFIFIELIVRYSVFLLYCFLSTQL